ncbi:uncharacterized protein LOC144070812 [Stigmatopora argus]
MKSTTLCTFATFLASVRLSRGGSGPCTATLRAGGPCGPGRSGCPYLLTLPPLTLHLPEPFRELEGLLKDLETLKEDVERLSRTCRDGGRRHPESRYDGTPDLRVGGDREKTKCGEEAGRKEEAAGKDGMLEELNGEVRMKGGPDQVDGKKKETQVKTDGGGHEQGEIWVEGEGEMGKQAGDSGLPADKSRPRKKDQGGMTDGEREEREQDNVQRDSDGESASGRGTHRTDFVSISPSTPASTTWISARGPEFFFHLDQTESITSSPPSPPFSDFAPRHSPVVDPTRTQTAWTESNARQEQNPDGKTESKKAQGKNTTENKFKSEGETKSFPVRGETDPFLKNLKPKHSQDSHSRWVATDQQARPTTDVQPESEKTPTLDENSQAKKEDIRHVQIGRMEPDQKPDPSPMDPSLKPIIDQDSSNNSQRLATDQLAKTRSDKQLESEETPILNKNLKPKDRSVHPVKPSQILQNPKPDKSSTEPSKSGQDTTNLSEQLPTDQPAKTTSNRQPESEETPILNKNSKPKGGSVHLVKTSTAEQNQNPAHRPTDPSLQNLKPNDGQDRTGHSEKLPTDQPATPVLSKNSKPGKESVEPVQSVTIEQKPTEPSIKNLQPKYAQDRKSHSQGLTFDEKTESKETPMLNKNFKPKTEPAHPVKTSKTSQNQKPDKGPTDRSIQNQKPKYGQDSSSQWETTDKKTESEETPNSKLNKEPEKAANTDQNQKPENISTDLAPKSDQDRTKMSQRLPTDQVTRTTSDEQPEPEETPIFDKTTTLHKETINPVKPSTSDPKQIPDHSPTDPSPQNLNPKDDQDRTGHSERLTTDQPGAPALSKNSQPGKESAEPVQSVTIEQKPTEPSIKNLQPKYAQDRKSHSQGLTFDEKTESKETPMLNKNFKTKTEPTHPVKTSKTNQNQKSDISPTDRSIQNQKPKYGQDSNSQWETTDKKPESEETPKSKLKKEPVHPAKTANTDQNQKPENISTDLAPKSDQGRTKMSQRLPTDQVARTTPEPEETPIFDKTTTPHKETINSVRASTSDPKQIPDQSPTDPFPKNPKPKHGQIKTTERQEEPLTDKQPEPNSQPKKGSVRPVKTSKVEQNQKPDDSPRDPAPQKLKPKYFQHRTNNSQRSQTDHQARPASDKQSRPEKNPALNKNSKRKNVPVQAIIKSSKSEQKQKPSKNSPKEKSAPTKSKQHPPADRQTKSKPLQKATALLHSNSSGNSESPNTFPTNPNQRLKSSQRIPKINEKYKTAQVPKLNQKQPESVRDQNPGASPKTKSSPDLPPQLGEDSTQKSNPRSVFDQKASIRPTPEATTEPAQMNEKTTTQTQQPRHFSWTTTKPFKNPQLLSNPSPVPQLSEDTDFHPRELKPVPTKTTKYLHGLPSVPSHRFPSDPRPQTATNHPPSTPTSATLRLLRTVIPRTDPGSAKTHRNSKTEAEPHTLNIISDLGPKNTANPVAIPVPESSTSSARELRVKIKQVAAAFFNGSRVAPIGKPPADQDLLEDNKGGSRPPGGSRASIPSEGAVSEAMRDCSDHLLRRDSVKSGIYQVTPDLHAGGGFPVLCDMEVQGGGWTLLQLRRDGGVSFNRTWAEYRSGFGEPSTGGEFWLGNQRIHLLTRDRAMTLRVELEDFSGTAGYAEYEDFRVASERMRYRLTLGAYSGTAGNALRFSPTYDHNNRAFTTPDRDNDRYPSGNCGAYYGSGWWFDACMAANLNGKYYRGRYKGVRDGIYWGAWHNISTELYPTNERESFKTVRMMIRPKGFFT